MDPQPLLSERFMDMIKDFFNAFLPYPRLTQSQKEVFRSFFRNVLKHAPPDSLTTIQKEALRALMDSLLDFVPGGEDSENVSGEASSNDVAILYPPTVKLICPKCQHDIQLPPANRQWYRISVGKRIGWVRGWEFVVPLVMGVSSDGYQYFENEESARSSFASHFSTHKVEIIRDEGPATYTPLSD
ncbi:hypothetical protein MPER_11992, partial [Moniliophthora perniciosa FA553]